MPPITTAPTAVTVAQGDLVSGFRRWNAVGPGSPEEPRDGRRGRVGLGGLGGSASGQAAASSVARARRSRSPCGNRAFVRRAMAFRMR